MSQQVAKTRPVKLNDVALAAGVTNMTVSRALKGTGRMSAETRERVQEIARQMGYAPNPHAQRLSSGQSENVIGLFCRNLDFGVATAQVNSIRQRLGDQGWEVPIYACSYGKSEKISQVSLMKQLCRMSPRAIVCSVGSLYDEPLAELQSYIDHGGFAVYYDQPVQVNCDSVIFDRVENTKLAMRHLVELGHRDIGFYCPLQHISHDARYSAPRLQAYFEVMQENGLTICDEWVMQGGQTEVDGELLAQRFLHLKNRPTAMCIINDRVSMAFLAALRESGIVVPDDLSVVSHDNTTLSAYGVVPLTTVSNPVEDVVDHVINLLRSRIDGSYQGPSRRRSACGELFIRRSCIQNNSIVY